MVVTPAMMPTKVLEAFAQNLALPLLVFNPSLRLQFYNDTASQVLEQATLGDLPHAAYFFHEQEVDDLDMDAHNLASIDVRAKLQDLLEEGRSFASGSRWGTGSRVRLWAGTEGDRVCRWYDALVQTVVPYEDLPTPRASKENVSSTLGIDLSTAWISVVLLRRLPFHLIRSASATLASGSARSVSFLSDGSHDHDEDDTNQSQAGSDCADSVHNPSSGSEVERLQDIVDHIPHIAFTTSITGEVTWLNKRWYEFTGLDPNKPFDIQEWLAHHYADDMAYALGAWSRSWETGTPLKAEYRLLNKDGSWRWMVAKAEACRNTSGAITHWVATATDVDELVQTRWTAEKVKEHVMAVLNGADCVLFSVDCNEIVTFFEGLTAAMLGSTVPGAVSIGSLLEEAWPDPELHHEVTKMLKEGSESATFQTKTILELAGGRRYRYRLTRLHNKLDDEVEGVIVVATDVTELLRIETALQEADQERAKLLASETAAREASRLKTAFVTNISHEIRTPIAVMIGIAELLLVDPSLGEGARELAGKCLKSGEMLLELVGMVLDMGKVEAGKLELEQHPFKLIEVLSDAGLFAISAQKKGLAFIENVPPSLYDGYLMGDSLRLKQILANFLSNSLKFTAKGSVTLRVRQEEESEAGQVIVTFEVEDTGVGIEEHAMPRLFSPFHQADSSTARQYGGSGLGLYLTRRFATMMHGAITLRSVYGRGTIVSARIPLLKTDVQPPSPSPIARFVNLEHPTSSPIAANGAMIIPTLDREEFRILLADDNQLIREVTHKILTKMKFHVDTVSDGQQAVDAMRTGNYNLILMDGQMPICDGYSATRLIRLSPDELIRNVKIVALTASAIRGDKERCLDAGMDAYLSKPIRAKALEHAILQQMASPASHRLAP